MADPRRASRARLKAAPRADLQGRAARVVQSDTVCGSIFVCASQKESA